MNRNTGNGSRGQLFRGPAGRTVCGLVSSLLLTGALGGPAFAQLDSTVTVTGKAGEADIQAQATETLEMEAPRPSLTVNQQFELDMAKGRDPDNADGGDTISVTVTVTNDGNFPVDRVVIDGASLSAGGESVVLEAAKFTPPSADIGTGETVSFTAIHGLTDEQVYRAVAGNGITIQTGAIGQAKGDAVAASAEPGNLLVAANPQLAIATTSVLEKGEGNEGEGAETGDAITYKYTVENVGNVSVADVAITVDLAGKTLQSAGTPDLGVDPFDVVVAGADPLGLSSDDSETAGVYDNLGPGGVVEFTHTHTVTQEEFEAQ